MKKTAFFWLIFLLIPVASAVQINTYDLESTVDNTLVKEEVLIFIDYQGETSVELLLPPSIRNLQASVNDIPVNCSQKEIISSTKVVCPVSVKSDYFIKLDFDTTFPIVSLDERKLFSQDLHFNGTVEKFNFRLKLPERAILPEEVEKFVSPEPDKIYSDGRRIILSYKATSVDEFDVSVIYEPAKKNPVAAFIAILSLTLIVVGVLLMKLAKKAKPEVKGQEPKEVEKVEVPKVEIEKTEEIAKEELYLLPDEKDIINILEQAAKPIRQKDIEKQITFSKAKLSRVLRGLEERGIIKRIPRGNTNLVELLKK